MAVGLAYCLYIYISSCEVTLQKCWDVKPGGKLKDMATPGSQLRQLLKIQNVAPENSIIVDHLRQNLPADWQEKLNFYETGHTQHSISPLDYDLGELASLAQSEDLCHSPFYAAKIPGCLVLWSLVPE